ncbi:hypothetical protein CCP3SC1AL1_760018 [Gammaproteobacteria bacterium]
MSEDLKNVRTIVQTALDLVEHGTFPGVAAPAVTQTLNWLRSMLSELPQQDEVHDEQAST